MKGGLHPLSRWEVPEVQHCQEKGRDKRDRKEQNSKANIQWASATQETVYMVFSQKTPHKPNQSTAVCRKSGSPTRT